MIRVHQPGLGTHRYSGDDSQSGRGTQANTYSDRTRSQGASSIPEKVPQSGVSTADSCTAGMPWTAKPRSSGRSRAKGAKAVSIAAMGAAPPLNLGNMLRATDPKVEAEAALRAATRADPTFAEAWYNLSDLLDEQGRSEAAIDCLRSRLRRTTPTRCLILRFRYSEVVGTRKPRSTGGNILPMMLNLNGQHARVDP